MMHRLPHALFCLMVSLSAAEGGTVEGTVRAEGVVADSPRPGNAYSSRKFRFAERVDYDKMKDFVVYLESKTDDSALVYTGRAAVVTQEDAIFDPHVLPVAAGTTVEWPNEDDIFHNVFSFSEPKPFDLGLYKDTDEVKAITFDKPGRVDVFCSIHKDMHCIILVLNTRHFARADEDGRYTIRDVPAGTYIARAWHERLPPQSMDITVPEDGTVEADFTMGIKGLPKY